MIEVNQETNTGSNYTKRIKQHTKNKEAGVSKLEEEAFVNIMHFFKMSLQMKLTTKDLSQNFTGSAKFEHLLTRFSLLNRSSLLPRYFPSFYGL